MKSRVPSQPNYYYEIKTYSFYRQSEWRQSWEDMADFRDAWRLFPGLPVPSQSVADYCVEYVLKLAV